MEGSTTTFGDLGNLSFTKACVLGDGCLGYPKNKNTCYISFTHSEKQRFFLEWKMKKVNQELNTHGSVNSREVFDKRTGKTYQSCQAMVTSKKLISVREELYPSGKKQISKKYLEDLGLEALAVFWMDDGCVVRSTNVGLLATYCDQDQATVIANWIHDLTETNPKLYIDRGLYRLRITRSEMPKFIYAIKPFMLSGFSHKVTLHFKNKTKSFVLYAASLNLPFLKEEEDDKKARAQDKQLTLLDDIV